MNVFFFLSDNLFALILFICFVAFGEYQNEIIKRDELNSLHFLRHETKATEVKYYFYADIQ